LSVLTKTFQSISDNAVLHDTITAFSSRVWEELNWLGIFPMESFYERDDKPGSAKAE
jgi:hypothetical protein